MLDVFVFVSVLTMYLSLWISEDSQIKEDRRGNSHLYFRHKLRLTPDQGAREFESEAQAQQWKRLLRMWP